MIIEIDEEISKKNEISGRILIAYSKPDKFDSISILREGFELEYLGKDFPESKCFGVKRTNFKMSYPEYFCLRDMEIKSAKDEEINKTIQKRGYDFLNKGLKALFCNNFNVYAGKEEHLVWIGFEYGDGFLVDEKDLGLGLELLIKDNMRISNGESQKVLDFMLQHL